LSMQNASEFASFRQGMTTDTSTACGAPSDAGDELTEVSALFMRES